MSSKPILYYTPESQPCRSVLLAAATIGIELELKTLNLFAGEHLTPEFLKVTNAPKSYKCRDKIVSSNIITQINPAHTIPTLVDGDAVITDSHAICTYLCDKYSDNETLYPRELVKRAVVDSRLHFDTGVLFARNRFLYEPVLYHSKPVDPERVEYLKKAWPLLEGYLSTGDYLAGNELTVADICAIATVSSVDEIAPIQAEEFPRLAAWVQRMQQLPHYETANGRGAEVLKKKFREAAERNPKQ